MRAAPSRGFPVIHLPLFTGEEKEPLLFEVFREHVAPEGAAAGPHGFHNHDQRSAGEHRHGEALAGKELEDRVSHQPVFRSRVR